MGLYERIAPLQVEIDSCRLEPLALRTGGGWARRTTVVRLSGGGLEGVGEDVAYDARDQEALQARDGEPFLHGRSTLDEASRALDRAALFEGPPVTPANALYRRWAFESAALDLALQQDGRSLGEVLGREQRPVRYAVSLGLGAEPSIQPLAARRELYPGLVFKVDLGERWSVELVRELASFGGVATVDFKGCYRGAFSGPRTRPELYRACAEHLPDAWLEDPDLSVPEAREALSSARDRVTWDAILHSVADLATLPWEPRAVNVKPSRFGLLSELFRTYEYCSARGIRTYGGGQFELGPGRAQIQELASLFHPDEANDVAPGGFNAEHVAPDLPPSPLPPALARGFGPR